MSTYSLRFPKQRLSYSEKMAKDMKWAKDTFDSIALDYISSNSNTRDGKPLSQYSRKLSNYRLYNNQLDQKDFEREFNPLGIEVGQFKDQVMAFNKAPNKINVLLGNELKRPFPFKTVLTNSEGIKSKTVERTLAIQDAIQQDINELVQMLSSMVGQPNMENPEEVERARQQVNQMVDRLIDKDSLDQYLSTNYMEAREILAASILDYLFHKQNLRDKMNDGFKHGLISGEEIYYVGRRNNDPFVEVVNPLGFFHHKSPETKYYQDGLYAGYRTLMTSGDILDTFQLTDKQVKIIEGTTSGVNGVRDDLIGPGMKYHNVDITHEYHSRLLDRGSYEGSYGYGNTSSDWLVTHLEWRSQRKIGFLFYINEWGDPQTDMVSEEFIVPDYAEKTTQNLAYGGKRTVYQFDNQAFYWDWVPEVWEGIRIGDNMYTQIGPKLDQFRSIDDPYKVKLGYHGVAYSTMNSDPVSLMDRMKPFQYLYFIVVHKLKALIAKDRGQVYSLDLSMVPEELGLEKALYYLDQMDLDLYNSLQNAEKPGAYQRGKVTGSTSRSNMQHIMNYIGLMDALDAQISDVAGIPRPVEGQISANEAVTNARSNIQQSATITEATYFHPHYRVWQDVLTSLLQVAQECYKGKKITKQYILDDMSIKALDFSGDDLQNSDFGIFVANAGKENEVYNMMKDLAHALVQTDKANFSDLIKMLKSSSIEDMERKIEAAEKKRQELEQQAQKMQQQTEQAKMEFEKAKLQHEKDLQAQKDAAELQRLIVELTADADQDNDGKPDILEVQKFLHDVNMDKAKLKLEEKKLKRDAKAPQSSSKA
jgi:hypothetical protein